MMAAGGQTMEGVVALKLKAAAFTVALAESCTGGLIGQRLTSLPEVRRTSSVESSRTAIGPRWTC